jgi:anti-sigma B factor antagonist
MFLTISSKIVDDVMVVDVSGELSRRASSLLNPLKDLLADGRSKLILDLSATSYVDSSGLGQLISLWTSIGKRGGQLILLRPSPRVRDQLEITKLNTVFTIIDHEAEALERIQKSVSARRHLAT